jgi:DNA-directed RNA polymerase I, II, and III subunit RPABC2
MKNDPEESEVESDDESEVPNQNSEDEDDDDEEEPEEEIFNEPNDNPVVDDSDVDDPVDDSEDQESNPDDYLQKLEHHLDTTLLESVHPEIHSCNYDEMISLTRIVRDVNGRIVDPLHQTLPFLTKYEKARIIGARAEQLDSGGQAFVAVEPHIINGRTIAIMEFEQKKIPFILARPLPNGSIEYWDIRDLEIIME